MTTILFGAIGAAVGGPVGGAIGAAIGGVVDNAIVFPALFPDNTDVIGPRLDGIQFGGSNEGEPIQWAYGPQVRAPGIVMWLDEIEEVETKKTFRTGRLFGFGGRKTTVTSFTYRASMAVLLGEVNDPQTIGRARKIFADAKIVWDDGTTAKYDSLTFYLGDQTTPDPIMESKLGAGRVPNFKNLAFFVVERLFITDYGNRVPRWSIKLEQDRDTSLQDFIKALVQRHDLIVSDVDVSRLPFCFRGISIDGPTRGTSVIDAVLATYAVTVQEPDGKIKFVPKGSEDIVTIVESEVGTLASPGIKIDDQSEFEVPNNVEIRFVNSDLDCQPGDEFYRNPLAPADATHKVSFNTPITLSGAEAKAIAKRLSWASATEREKINVVLPPRYLKLVAGDALSLTFDERSFYIFCKEVTIGANYEVAVSGFVMDPNAYDQTAVGQLGFIPGVGYTPPDLDAIIIDMAGLTQDEVETMGSYWAVQTIPLDDQFLGAELHGSFDDILYTKEDEIGQTANMGTVDAGMDKNRSATEIDYGSALDVTIESTPLSSAAEGDVFRGLRNIAAIETDVDQVDGTVNWEIVGFLDVESIGDDKYRLTRLVRGMRGTEYLIPLARVGGGRFILLEDDDSLGFFQTGAVIGQNIWHKVVAQGALLSSVEPLQRTHRGRSARCFAPTHVRVKRQYSSGTARDAVFTWERRTKMPDLSTGFVAVPSFTDDETNLFQVEMRVNTHPSAFALHTESVEGTTWTLTEDLRDALSARYGAVWNTNYGFWFWVRQYSGVSGLGERSEPMFVDNDFLPV